MKLLLEEMIPNDSMPSNNSCFENQASAVEENPLLTFDNNSFVCSNQSMGRQ